MSTPIRPALTWAVALAVAPAAAQEPAAPIAERGYAAALAAAEEGDAPVWEALVWSRRLYREEAPEDPATALQRRLARLRRLVKVAQTRAPESDAAGTELVLLKVLVEEAATRVADPRGERRRAERLSAALDLLAGEVALGDLAGLRRFAAMSRDAATLGPDPDEGRGDVFEERPPSPAEAAHRARVLGLAGRWLGEAALEPAARSVVLLVLEDLADFPRRRGWAVDVADVAHRRLLREPDPVWVEVALEAAGGFRPWPDRRRRDEPGAVLRFEAPRWAPARFDALEAAVADDVEDGALPETSALLVAYAAAKRGAYTPPAPPGDLPVERQAALRRVGEATAAERTRLVTELADHVAAGSTAEVRRAACWALARLGPPAPRAVEPLIRSCRSADWRVAHVDRFSPPWPPGGGAAAALGRLGRPAVRPLLEELAGDDPDRRRAALRTLEQLVPSARRAGTVGDWVDGARPALVAALSDDEAGVRAGAADALGALGPWAAPATLELGRRLGVEPDAPTRVALAEALARQGPLGAAGAPALRAQLAADDADLAEAAARALGRIATPAAVEALAAASAAAGSEPTTRESCLEALALCGPPAEAALRDALAGPRSALALEALTDLGFGPETGRAIAALLGPAAPDSSLALAALKALRQHPLGALAAVDALEAFAADQPAGSPAAAVARRTLAYLRVVAAARGD